MNGRDNQDIYIIVDGLLQAVGQEATETVKTRTQAGKDVKDTDFARYSRSWAEVRTERGLITHKVDLTFDNIMLNAMKLMRVENTLFDGMQAIVGFNDPESEAKARANERIPKSKPRVFFGFSENDIDRIYALGQDYLNG